jgi:hypothetical protein
MIVPLASILAILVRLRIQQLPRTMKWMLPLAWQLYFIWTFAGGVK